MSVAYTRSKSRTERPRKIKIGTEVDHVTPDSENHFQDQKVKGQGHQAALLSAALAGKAAAAVSVWLGVETYCYVAVCSAALGASAPREGGKGRGISWRPTAYSLLM